MANNLTKNPWVLDTQSNNYIRSGTTTPAPTGLSQASQSMGPIAIATIIFSGYSTGNTDQAILTDEDGIVFATLNGNSDKTAVGFSIGMPFRKWDFALTTLTSGKVSVFVR